MPTIAKMNGAAAPKFVPWMAAAAGRGVPVPRELLRVMAAAGVDAPGDVDRLTEQQMNKVLEGKMPGERMVLKAAMAQAGILPRSLTIGRAITWPPR